MKRRDLHFNTCFRQHEVAAEESGSVLLEFALSIVLLLTLVFSILDYSRMMYSYNFAGNVAREATRYAMVRGATWSGTTCTTTATASCMATAANVTSYVLSITPKGFTSGNLTVNTTWPGTTVTGADCSTSNVNNGPGCVVSVQVSYAYSFVLPFLPKGSFALSSTSKVTIAE